MVHWCIDGMIIIIIIIILIIITCVEDDEPRQPASARGRAHRTDRDTKKTDDAEGLREYALLQLTWRRVHTHTHKRRISPTRRTLPHPARKQQRARARTRSRVHTRTCTDTLTRARQPALRHTHTRARARAHKHTHTRAPVRARQRDCGPSARAPATHFVVYLLHGPRSRTCTQRLVETGSSVIHQSVRPKRHRPITVPNTCKHLHLHGAGIQYFMTHNYIIVVIRRGIECGGGVLYFIIGACVTFLRGPSSCLNITIIIIIIIFVFISLQ